MKVLVTGGGTGGHIYPALAIIDEIKRQKPNAEFLYVGTKAGLEHEVVVKAGIPFEMIDVKGFTGGGLVKKITIVQKAGSAVLASMAIAKRFKPDLVIGTGGYVSGPMVLGASLAGYKTAIHEQNVFPGKTNKMLERFVKKVYLSYEESAKYFTAKEKLVWSGNPVRNEFESLNKTICRKDLNIPQDTFLVVSFGGSGGAKRINETMLLVMNYFKNEPKVKLIHITGKSYYERFMRCIGQSGLTLGDNASVKDYLFDIPKYLCAADLVIGRSGATSLSELLAVKTPSVLIPSPNVAEDHQTYNAKEMVRIGVSHMIAEKDLTDQLINDFINDCLEHPQKLDKMKKAFEAQREAKAAQIIVSDLLKLI